MTYRLELLRHKECLIHEQFQRSLLCLCLHHQEKTRKIIKPELKESMGPVRSFEGIAACFFRLLLKSPDGVMHCSSHTCHATAVLELIFQRHDHRCIQKYVSYSCMSTMLKIIQHPEIVFNIALFTRSMTYEYQTTCTVEFAIPLHSPCDQTSHSGAAPPGDTSGAIRWFQKTWT